MGPQKTQLPPAMGSPDPQRPGPGPEVGDTSLSEAVATLRKRRWILILAAVLGAGYGWYKAITQPTLFVASSTVQVHNGSSNAYRVDSSGGDYEDDSSTRMNTEVYILRSDTLLETVARQMDLPNNPDFWGSKEPRRLSMDEPGVRQRVLGLLRGIGVTQVRNTELIQIAYTSPSAKLSADIVNKVVDAYIQRSLDVPALRTQKGFGLVLEDDGCPEETG